MKTVDFGSYLQKIECKSREHQRAFRIYRRQCLYKWDSLVSEVRAATEETDEETYNAT
jgi:hypothetical protein